MDGKPTLLKKAAAAAQASALLLFLLEPAAFSQALTQAVPVPAGSRAGIVAVVPADFPSPVQPSFGIGTLPALRSPGSLALPASAIARRSAPLQTLPAPEAQALSKEAAQESRSALLSLLRHGPEAGRVASIAGDSSSREAAESRFLLSAGLGASIDTGQAAEPVPAEASETGLFRKVLGKLLPGKKKDLQLDESSTLREVRLDNGMVVRLLKTAPAFTATISVGYEVGGRDEKQGELGDTHFVEHLMFQGTRRIRNWFRLVGSMGAQTSASTFRDHTIYTQNLPVNLLELGISLEAERMMNLDVTPAKVEREKGTILEEKARRDDEPYSLAQDTLLRMLFSNPRNHSDVIGPEGDILSATAPRLQRHLDEYYGPDRAHVAISGGIDLDKTEAWVREYFGAVPARAKKTPSTDLGEPKGRRGRTAAVKDPHAALPAVLFGWQGPKYKTPEFYATGILAQVLTDRLVWKTVYGDHSAVSAGLSFPYLERDPGVLQGAITLGSGMSPERALARVDEELRAIAGGEIRDSELASMIDLQVRQIQQSLGYTPEAETLALLSVRGLGWQDLQDDIGRWRQVSSEDLRRAARALLSGDKRSAVIVEPGEARRDPVSAPRRAAPSRVDDTPTPEEMDLLRSLARLDWSGYTFKKPSEFVLPNGLKVILMPDPRIPTVYAKLAFRLGRTSADSGLRAKVPLVAQLMRMRTAGSDEKAIEDRLSEMQGTLAADQKWDHSVFDGNAPSEQAPDLLGLLAEVASRPEAWTAEKLDSWKAWFKQNLGQDKADAGFASHLRALKDLLGGHPSANATVTPETVDSLTPEEVERIAREHFAPDNAVLVLAGAVDPRAIKAQVESLFGSWKPSGVRQARSPLPEILPQARISLIDRPGSEQTFIRMTALAPQAGSQGSADHFPLVVANQILGTGFASRLFQVVRQGLGLAYEAFSSVATDPALAMWTFGLYTRPEKTSQALDALLLQARLMREEAPDEVELGGAKNAIIGSFLMSLDAIGQIADHLLGLELFGQPLAEWGLYPAKVSAVTSEAVREIAERILDLDKTAVTVVADARAVRGQIEGRRPLDEFDSNGDPKNPPALASLIR